MLRDNLEGEEFSLPPVDLPIAGLQKLTLQDFPGTPAAIVFTRGCNLRCSYCHNPELLTAAKCATQDYPVAQLWEFLRHRRRQLAGLVISGGEPTIHRPLPAFIQAVRALGYRIKLDSNGQRPAVIEGLLAAGQIDYLALDWKFPAADYGRCGASSDATERLQRCAAAARRVGVPFEWRTTVVEPLHDFAALNAIAVSLQTGDRWALQAFNPDCPVHDPTVCQRRPNRDLLEQVKAAHPQLHVVIR